MIDRSLTARLLGPAGLVIAGLGLLLPFGAVSCEGPPGQSVTLTVTGAHLIGNSGGTFSATSGFPEIGNGTNTLPPDAGSRLLHDADVTDPRMLLIVVVVLLVVGVFAVLIRQRLLRATVLAAVAVSTAILLVGAQVSGHHAVVRFFAEHPGLFGPNEDGRSLPDGVDIRPGAGFWSSLALLIVVAIGSIVAILRNTRRSRQPEAAQPPLPDGERTQA